MEILSLLVGVLIGIVFAESANKPIINSYKSTIELWKQLHNETAKQRDTWAKEAGEWMSKYFELVYRKDY